MQHYTSRLPAPEAGGEFKVSLRTFFNQLEAEKKYCGIDLHSNNSVMSVLDEEDHVVVKKRLPNDRVRAHIFPCMFAHYVEWYMRQAWGELMFADEDKEAKLIRDQVAPARRSDAAMQKVLRRTLEDGSRVHSFQTLMAHFKLSSETLVARQRAPATCPCSRSAPHQATSKNAH